MERPVDKRMHELSGDRKRRLREARARRFRDDARADDAADDAAAAAAAAADADDDDDDDIKSKFMREMTRLHEETTEQMRRQWEESDAIRNSRDS